MDLFFLDRALYLGYVYMCLALRMGKLLNHTQICQILTVSYP